MKEHKPSHEVQDCIEAQIWERVEKEFVSISLYAYQSCCPTVFYHVKESESKGGS